MRSLTEDKLAFLSYSHQDKDFAERIALKLIQSGIGVWWDEWEIKAGDSIIGKIFREGLAKCDVFLILLSRASVESKWVKDELDSAMIKRIKGSTRIIPLFKEQCEAPPPLQALKWVDLSKDLDEGIREVVKSIYEVSEKPSIGKIPDYILELKDSVGGLSQIASTIGWALLMKIRDDQLNIDKYYESGQIQALVPDLTPQEINDGVEELEEFGLLRVERYMGTAPYNFGDIMPTYALFLHFRDAGLDYDPAEDIKIVASAVDLSDEANGKDIQTISGLQTIRINRAVDYLDDYGIAKVIRAFGTLPFTFLAVWATRKTRQFVGENSK